eukprot:GFYU01013223.1.p1 GENE.GFYU01013223.1~~GFYU01013223.1.p1  ORF type:complete len:536 (+),score=182.94 GFYU01013223.1:86-1693(+)
MSLLFQSARLLTKRSTIAGRYYSTSSKFLLDEYKFLSEDLGIQEINPGFYNGSWGGSGDVHTAINPTTGRPIAQVQWATAEEYDRVVAAAVDAQKEWRELPVPARGEVVRKIGMAIREKQESLGKLITLEMGKIKPEGVGEVQEAVDICDFAVGLSRSLNGQVIPSERPGHFMMERWNPIGTIGIISAFNFPCAVYFWNAAISLVAGNTQVWKGAPSASLVTYACSKLVADVLEKEGLPGGICGMVMGSNDQVADRMIRDTRLPLISFTGSSKVGGYVNEVVASRFGRPLLELGGNNAAIIMDDANMDLALPATMFSAVGTVGQRCTTLRRLYVHEDVHDSFLEKLKNAWGQVPIGDPMEEGTLCGPLHNPAAVETFKQGLEKAQSQGGKLVVGGDVLDRPGNFVQPAIVSIDANAPIVKEELFVPIMYVMKFKNLQEAIAMNNDVPQGLSSSLFTTNQSAVFEWTGPSGSDCGIVNVNIGPSGAEIGGAFGGEKETGGGRESGSDAWKQYMRRQTCTVNYSKELPLAQGIQFNV